MSTQIISYMMDLSRNAVPNKEFLKEFIDLLSKMGYNELQLYMEDTYEVEGEPYFGYFRGVLNKDFIKEIDKYAASKGIRLVPAIEVLGHLAKLFRWGKYREIRDSQDVLLEGDEKTYILLDKMFSSLRNAFSCDVINIGMDETYALGRGKHLDRHGHEPHKDVFLRHLAKVSEIASKYGFKPMMWGDMFISNENDSEYIMKNPRLSDETIKLKPSNITPIYWDYYSFDKSIIRSMAKTFQKLDKNFIYAGGNWSWRGFAPRNDTSLSVSKAIIPIMKKFGCNYFINTSWGDDGNECPELSTIPSTFAFAQLAKGNYDLKDIKEKFFNLFGIKFDDFMSLDDLNNIGNKRKLDIIFKRNPAKYMLFSDPLGSPFDATVNVQKANKFKRASRKYKKHIDNKEFGYVFKLEYELAKVLFIKYPLGVNIRNAYKEKNFEALNECVKSLIKLEKQLAKFYDAVRYYWMHENSLFGFEVMDLRLGGLIQRVKSAKSILNDYINKKITKIDILEIPLEKYDNVEFGEEIVEQTHLKCVTTAYTSFDS